MKKLFTVLGLAALLAVCVPTPAAFAASANQIPDFDTILNVVLKIALGFTALAGVSGLNALIVQFLKLPGWVSDGNSAKVAAGLNLFAFFVLVGFGVFAPQITLEILDGYAAQLTVIGLFILGFITQMTTSKPIYKALKDANVPILGKSYSK